jgi:hypothetical protein
MLQANDSKQLLGFGGSRQFILISSNLLALAQYLFFAPPSSASKSSGPLPRPPIRALSATMLVNPQPLVPEY